MFLLARPMALERSRASSGCSDPAGHQKAQGIRDRELPLIVFPVHRQRGADVAIIDGPDRGQLIGSRTLKPVAPQRIYLCKAISCYGPKAAIAK